MFKRKVRLNCYTHLSSVIELQPIKKAVKNPSWWSKVKSLYEVYDAKKAMHIKTPTIKTCPGTVDYIRKPININLWTDLEIIVHPDGKIKSSGPMNSPDGIDTVDVHSTKQYHPDLYGNSVVVKLVSPWVIQSDDETDFLLAETHYSPELRNMGITVIPGILNFKYQHSFNVFLVLPVKEEKYKINLKYDMPLASLFPMTEREVDIRMHEVDGVFMNKMVGKYPSVTSGRYYAFKRLMKKKS